MKIRIDGIYDQRTLKSVGEISIKDISFDFRPLSTSFFQQYRFLDLVEKHYSKESRYFLHFADEADFMITKMIEDIRNLFDGEFPSNIFLEFSDVRKLHYYDLFEVPFYLHYSGKHDAEVYKNSKFLSGVIHNYKTLAEIHEAGNFFSFVNNFGQLIMTRQFNEEFEVGLATDWDDDIFPSLFDLMDFDLVSLPINSKVEVCYRNVDLNKLRDNLSFFA